MLRFFKRAGGKSLHDSYDIPAYSDSQLKEEYLDALKTYENNVGADWQLSVPDIDDAGVASDYRDYLHQVLQECTKRNISIDTSKLRKLDAQWQEHILRRIPIDLADRDPFYIRQEVPKTEWWFWIEELDQLTVEERNTLS